MERIDNNHLNIEPNDIIVFSKVRNESLRLPFFINYHRRLGVTKFVMLENCSNDDTRQYLLSQPDIITYFSETPFSESFGGTIWLNPLLDRYGHDRWTLTLDPDELLVYPNIELISIPQLCAYLDEQNRNAFKTIMLDMYSDKPIIDTIYNIGENFLEICPFFDPIPLTPDGRGGPRKRKFWDTPADATEIKPPMLIKTPLVKWQKNLNARKNPHLTPNTRAAEETGALLHFKFFSEFINEVETAVDEKNYWDNSAQYKIYQKSLKADPNLTFHFEGSTQYQNSQQLITLNLIKTSERLEQFSNDQVLEGNKKLKLKRTRQWSLRNKNWFNYIFTIKSPNHLKHLWLWTRIAFLKNPANRPHLPWFTLPAIDWLQTILTKDMRIFEWGSGTSTLFFADRCAQVISVEHDLSWYSKVSKDLTSAGRTNVDIAYLPINPRYIVPLKPGSEFVRANPKQHYRELLDIPYIKKIQEYPDQYFDFVIVDGRARNACALASMVKIKIGGGLIFDDAQRPRYSGVQRDFNPKSWEKLIFYGPSPFDQWNPFKHTTVFLRKN